MSVLLTAFFQTQVLNAERYRLQAEDNRLQPVTIPAPRGTIYDRYGEVIATSIPGFAVFLMPARSEAILEALTDLQPFLGLANSDIKQLSTESSARPQALLLVTDDATFSQIAALEERRASFPGVLIVDRPKRYYPAGDAIGHLIGYVSEITAEQLELPEFVSAGYTQGRTIGQAGFEKQYELELSGVDGARYVEVDALGRIVNPRSTVSVLAPKPGADMRTTLDLRLQRYVSEIFPDTMKGALVALVPSTGEILAMVSNPSYDPNDFVGGVSTRLWNALRSDPLEPLLDRTISSRYPPASTFKLATAIAGIRRGIVRAETRMSFPCTGGLLYAGRYSRCWYVSGHGSLTLAQAIEKSCNVYFYQLGIQLGLKDLTEFGTRLGFGRRSGIDLPGERPGIFPTGAEWYDDNFGYVAPSEIMSLAIGQGPNAQSVLRMALFYSAIGGNGTAARPHILDETPPERINEVELGLTRDQLSDVWAGLELVTRGGGTGVQSGLERWQIFGKTGTAQNPPNPSHGWFAGFSGPPGEHAEIAVAVIVEHGLHGDAVAPLGAKAINFYLDRKHGLPFDPQPTLIERWESGRQPWGLLDEYPSPLEPR